MHRAQRFGGSEKSSQTLWMDGQQPAGATRREGQSSGPCACYGTHATLGGVHVEFSRKFCVDLPSRDLLMPLTFRAYSLIGWSRLRCTWPPSHDRPCRHPCEPEANLPHGTGAVYYPAERQRAVDHALSCTWYEPCQLDWRIQRLGYCDDRSLRRLDAMHMCRSPN
jgi:hypothetical protein